MDNDPVLQVPADCPGERRAFHVAAEAAQVIDRAPVADPDDVLLDDRPRVQFRGHVVGGRADELHATLVRLQVRLRSGERRQERVMDVDHRAADAEATALDALGATYLRLAGEAGIDPALLHRVTTISAGTLDSLPHNGAVVSLLAVCGLTHRESYGDMVMVGIVGALLALLAVIGLGSSLGSF